MTNKFYVPGEERAERVHDLFDAIAPRYDLINDLQSFGLHRLWKKRLLKLAAPRRGLRALDLCCGTGDVAFALAREGAKVIGLDFSERMLAVAAQRVVAWAGVQDELGPRTTTRTSTMEALPPNFVRGDASQIPFPDASFDIVTISYGLRNLADWERGLSEMHRVLRPGGRLLVLDFGKPDNALWRGLYFGYLRWIVPVFGRIFCGDADTHGYILESLRHYTAQKGVAAKMTALRFTDVRVINLLGGMMSINFGVKAT